VDKLIPVDVYIPGCPPRPEAVIDAIIKLRKKIANESVQERHITQQTHRYYSIPHRMKVVPPVNDGMYLASLSEQVSSQEIETASGFELPTLKTTANAQNG
jgi:NAD(P)H-quinone oxidoreductase subunit K